MDGWADGWMDGQQCGKETQEEGFVFRPHALSQLSGRVSWSGVRPLKGLTVGAPVWWEVKVETSDGAASV